MTNLDHSRHHEPVIISVWKFLSVWSKINRKFLSVWWNLIQDFGFALNPWVLQNPYFEIFFSLCKNQFLLHFISNVIWFWWQLSHWFGTQTEFHRLKMLSSVSCMQTLSKPSLDCKNTFPIDLAPNGIPFDVQRKKSVNYNLNMIWIYQIQNRFFCVYTIRKKKIWITTEFSHIRIEFNKQTKLIRNKHTSILVQAFL